MPTSLIAAVIGLVLGVGTALIWRAVSTRVRRVEFWPAVAGLARSVTAGGDEREFLRQYARVLGLLARYLGRQALILGLSFLPVTLFVTLATAGGEFAIGSRSQNIVDGGSRQQVSGQVPPGFAVESAAGAASVLILRPSRCDDRLFWPRPGDPQSSFYLALCVASAAGMIILPRRRT